jgi:hypothetical protein
MIDIDNFTRAIQWLRRGLADARREPDNPSVQLSLLQSFEVTYNLSETILRHAYAELSDDEDALFISTRELLWRAGEEGIALSTRKQWMQYGLALESMREACMSPDGLSVQDSYKLLAEFSQELESFAGVLRGRLVSNV